MPSPAKPQNFFRYFLLVLLGLGLGAATLVVGLGAGRMVGGRFLAQQEAPHAAAPNTRREPAPVTFAIGYEEVDFSDAIEAVRHAVVSISVFTRFGMGDMNHAAGSGSGFIFYQDSTYAYIATNNHVTENTQAIKISLDDEMQLEAQLIGACRDNDLAVLRVPLYVLEESGKPYGVATLGSSDVLRVGDSVAAIGNALGGGTRTTLGIVSALSLTIRIPDPATGTSLDLYVFQTDAAVNRGNSGGPLINEQGEVVGVITAKFMGQGVEGMGYVLPIDNIRELMEEIREEGSIVIPFIGIGHNEIDDELRQLFNLPVSQGQWITRVTPGTPASEAGLERGDIIVRFNETEITSFLVFREALLASRVGETVTLGILRRGEYMDVEVTLGAPR